MIQSNLTLTQTLQSGLEAVAVGAPTIDLDKTIVVQLVLFVVLWLFLSAVVFRPYLEAHRERVRLTEGERKKAAQANERADALLSEYETTLARARAEAGTIRAALLSDAKREAEALVASAREDSARQIESARAELEEDLARVRSEVEPRARELSEVIATKILA